ncbi:MAG: hypothetical protein A4S09_16355 [Proteobacteria bacterium SG_bin7]|nr:MAG: hypothetical protein A4S09_16355 [Proteobacteria bacterium SG_bin7]
MPQKLFEDKIGLLSHSAGSITLAASRLTIGGQQYVTTSLTRAIATDLTMTANTLYMIYAVLNSGVVELRFSANVNSSGPAGFTAWKLVGAFYSNATPAFGAFVNIDGIPMSGEIAYSPSLQSSGGGNITLNATGVISPYGYWQRIGNQLKMYAGFRNGTGGTATGAAGGIMLGLPSGIVGTSNRASDGNFGTFVASGGGYKGGPGADTHDWYFVSNGTTLTPIRPLSGSVLAVADLVAQYSLNVDTTFGIAAWSNTPLKDL